MNRIIIDNYINNTENIESALEKKRENIKK